MHKILFGIFTILISSQVLLAQKPLEEVESQLSQMAKDILNHPNFEVQKSQNRDFTRLLIQTLKRPESFAYDFDSLKTISILNAEDKTFRLFTWQITKRQDTNSYYGEVEHFYFGLVQRKYLTSSGETEYLVIPLIEMPEIPRGIENMVLDNNNWLGGLYYPPKYGNGIQKRVLKYYDARSIRPGKKAKRQKQSYYVLMGWNGMDNSSNLKFIDVMSFDPKDSSKVIFGANVFYFDKLVPKFRALFKYSEYAPFTLNYGYIKKGFSKKMAIVYDHMGTPKQNQAKLKEIWDMGPDGSYDALYYSGGAFDWKKNVETVSVLSTRDRKNYAENQEKILRSRLAELKRMASFLEDKEESAKAIAEIEEVESRKNLDKYALKFIRKKEKLILKRQAEIQEREANKLKEAGIDLSEDN